MRAKKGEWFSIVWTPRDFYKREGFESLKHCPRFVYAEKDSGCIEQEIEAKYPDLRISSIHLTSMFLKQEDGMKIPTHYRPGEFMPGDNIEYDKWLKEYFDVHFEIKDQIKDKELLLQKNIYLEHAARIIRHDMHSGINTYIPRGLNSLLNKLDEETIKKLRLGPSIKLLEEGLKHSQKVYQGVYAFTNLVKRNSQIDKHIYNLKEILEDNLSTSAYRHKVVIEDLCDAEVNKSLFCTAIDNFIKNGLTYNESKEKLVKIYMQYKKVLVIEDNGTGMTQQEYDQKSLPFIKDNKESNEPIGLGINIANAILNEHGFKVSVEKIDVGTKIIINLS